jgi:hypothetical protein
MPLRRLLVLLAFARPSPFALCTSRSPLRRARRRTTHRWGGEVAPIYGVRIPAGYRDWVVVNVAHEAGNLNDFRVVLGNAVAMKAFRDGTLPFPDGTIIARLAWKYVPSPENNAVFGRDQSFVTGAPTNLEFMVKDSKKYATTAGWGFGQFTDGKPDDEAVHRACFPCHGPAKGHDFLFTRYAP